MQVQTQYLFRKQTETSHRCRLLSPFITNAEQERPADMGELRFVAWLEGKKIPSIPHKPHQWESCLMNTQHGTKRKDPHKKCEPKKICITDTDRRVPASQQLRWQTMAHPRQQHWKDAKARLIWLPRSLFLLSVICLDAGPSTKASLR